MPPIAINPQEIYAMIDSRIARHPKRRFLEIEDLRQDIVIAVIERSPDFDPARTTWEEFVGLIVKRHIANRLSSQKWNKNKPPESLDEIAATEPERLPLLNDVGFRELGIQERAVYSLEIQEVVDTLPPKLRKSCESLKHYSVRETSEILGLSQTTLHRHVEEIRSFFSKANMTPDEE